MSETDKIWTRASTRARKEGAEADKRQELLLIGREISREWLKGSVHVTQVNVEGRLRELLTALREVAKSKTLNLPIGALRLLLGFRLPNLISLDKDLGLKPDEPRAAIELFSLNDDDIGEARTTLKDAFDEWIVGDVETWAHRHGLDDAVGKLREAVEKASFTLSTHDKPFVANGGRPNFPLIARAIGNQLAGEDLFPGLAPEGNADAEAPCELVVGAERSDNEIELMTRPCRGPGRDEVFSMAARLSVVTLPFHPGIFLSVSPVKRVWASRVPARAAGQPRRVTGYVLANNQQFARVTVERTDEGWRFSDEYEALLRESNNQLPKTLEEAVAQRQFDEANGWWAGLPELRTLFRYVSPSTAFESDEADLLASVCRRLGPVVMREGVALKNVTRMRQQAAPRKEMLRATDIGAAGGAVDEAEPDGEDGEGQEEDQAREERLRLYQEQNKAALRNVHDAKVPVVWFITDMTREWQLADAAIRKLFGEEIEIHRQHLPAGTHGLREQLDGGEKLKARQRFSKRVRAWQSLAKGVQERSAGRPTAVIVCVSDQVGNRTEDPVNYYAGIHAFSSIGANVHYVKPIEETDSRKATTAYLQRLQSAVLDVLLAHAGVVLGVKDFVARTLPAHRVPAAVYGVQAVTSQGSRRTGETAACFVLFSRIETATGFVSIRLVYSTGALRRRTEWMPLSAGLSWIGKQGSLKGTRDWLRANFEAAVREQLGEIAEAEKNAVILLDWDTTRGYWKGMSDEDLRAGAGARIGEVKIDGEMTVIRLRSREAMALRCATRVSYQGWDVEGNEPARPNGEVYVESYMTTVRRVVEVEQDSGQQRRSRGHFIGTMGYRDTVQVTRGLSCYRSRPRMLRLTRQSAAGQQDKSSDEFKLTLKPQATFDAGLPAAMDITVVQCPEDTEPSLYASLVMGLRLGYAHYNNWTRLPAPLFYRSKVDDYVIGFSEEDGETVDKVEPTAVSADADVASEATDMTRTVAEAVVTAFEQEADGPSRIPSAYCERTTGIDQKGFEARVCVPLATTEEDSATVEAAEEVSSSATQGVVEPAETDLIGRARLAMEEYGQVYDLLDAYGRQVQARILSGALDVRVALPYWLRGKKNVFQFNAPFSKRLLEASWSRFKRYGFVSARVQSPSQADYEQRLIKWLSCPQGLGAIAAVTRPLGGAGFRELQGILDKHVKPTLPPGESLSPFGSGDDDEKEIGELAKWALDRNHDALLGWLVLLAAQIGHRSYRGLFAAISAVPGPRTEHALHYFLKCHEVVKKLKVQCKEKGFYQIIEELPPPTLSEVPPYVPPAEPVETAQASADAMASRQSQSIEPTAPGVEEQADVLMVTKANLNELITAIEPGAEGFDETMQKIRDLLGTLEGMHEDRKEEAKQRAAAEQGWADLLERQRAVATRLGEHLESLELKSVRASEIDRGSIHEATDEIGRIEGLIELLEATIAQHDELRDRAQATGLKERAKRSTELAALQNEAAEHGMRLRELLASSMTLVVEDGLQPPPGGSPSGDDAGKQEVAGQASEPQGVEAIVETLNAAAAGEEAITQAAGKAAEQATDVPAVVAEAKTEAVGAIGTERALAPTGVPIEDRVAAPAEGGATEGTLQSLGDVKEAKAPEAHIGAKEAEAVTTVETLATVEEEMEAPLAALSFESRLETLAKLLERRLYGVADVHTFAMGIEADQAGDEELQKQNVILRALVHSLELMDCQLMHDPTVGDALAPVLRGGKVPSGDYASPKHMGLAVLATGLGNLMLDREGWEIGNFAAVRLADVPALAALVEHLDNMRNRGLVISREMFVMSKIDAKKAIAREMKRLEEGAKDWKRSAEIYSTFNHRAFHALHEEMFSQAHPIGRCVNLIAKGDAVRLAKEFSDAQKRFAKPAQTVEDMFKRTRERNRPEGGYRVHVIQNIQTTEKMINAYLDLVRKRDSHTTDLPRDVRKALDELNEHVERGLAAARKIECATGLEKLYAAAAVKALECACALFEQKDPAACIPSIKQKLLINLPMGKDFMPLLTPLDEMTGPLSTPDDVFEETERIADEPISMAGATADDDIDQALADTFEMHVDAKRFLPAFAIEQVAQQKVQESKTGREFVRRHYMPELNEFEKSVQEQRQRVVHAMTLNALPLSEADRMQRFLASLLVLCKQGYTSDRAIGRPGAESSVYCDFPQARAALQSNVVQPLKTRLDDSIRSAEAKLDALSRDRSESDIARVRAHLKSSNAADLRTAYDLLSRLERGDALPPRAVGELSVAVDFEQVVDHIRRATTANKRLLDELVRLLKEEPAAKDPSWLVALNKERRAEALDFIEAWIAFFSARNVQEERLVTRLFRAMGLSETPTPNFADTQRHLRGRLDLPTRGFDIRTPAEDPLFVPPELGSLATLLPCYALWSPATPENEIRLLSADSGSRPMMVMVRRRLTMEERARIGNRLAVLLVDDDLIAYAALKPAGERLRTILRVALLTYMSNPYDDYNTQPAPPEMFFGRQDELKKLRNVKGLAVLYGGRRLGKSSLLSQIERESRNPKQGVDAVYMSMDSVDTSGDFVLDAWQFLHNKLVTRNVIKPMTQVGTDYRAIQRHIESEVLASRLTALYLLIDETDKIMSRELERKKDAKEGFVRGLAQLAENVAGQCQLRVVLAGLHNMARLSNDSNSEFGKAESISLQPFITPEDLRLGQRLIIKPLQALGFTFDGGGEELPNRIMAVTNYWPAFTQLYCKRLMDALHNARGTAKPPFAIKKEILDDVEQDGRLLASLQEKFKLNLNLDRRYKGIAYVLADAYYTDMDAGKPHQGMTSDELKVSCDAFCGPHFERTNIGAMEALLDEMSKLTIVAQIGSRYMLRNPHISMMLGDRADISAGLSSLADEPVEQALNYGDRRVFMEKDGTHAKIVFPMPLAWLRNNTWGPKKPEEVAGDLMILVGNAKSGLDDLQSLSERADWRPMDGGVAFCPVPANGPQSLLEEIQRIKRKPDNATVMRILGVRSQHWRVNDVPELASVAAKAKRNNVRIALLASPERGLELARALDDGRLKLPADGDPKWRVVPVPPWSVDAIHFLVSENAAIADSREAPELIRAATGGFGDAVRAMCTATLSLEDCRKASNSSGLGLGDSREEFFKTIGMPPSLSADELHNVAEFLELMNGFARGSQADAEDIRAEYGIKQYMEQFLHWMGLLQEGPHYTWSVPQALMKLKPSRGAG